MDKLFFRVAEACFSVSSNDTSYVKKLIPSFAPFHLPVAVEPVIMNMSIRNGELDDSPAGTFISSFECANGIFRIYQLQQGYKIVICTMYGALAGVMKCDKAFTDCVVSLFGSQKEQAYALNNALMTAFTFSAAYHDTIMMHASVIANQDRGYLFLGPSGTGKSTHSQLWLDHIPGSELLNDDNPAIHVSVDGEVQVYGTPWSGKTPCYKNLHYPVQAFVRLHQHSQNIIGRLNTMESFATVLSSSSIMRWDMESYNRILSTVERIVKRAPAYQLQCLPDKAAAVLSHQTIAPDYGN